MGGIVDRQVKGQIFRPGSTFFQMHPLHLVELLLDAAQILRRPPPRRNHAGLAFDAAAHLERL